MHYLHIFNPSNDLALAANAPAYTPPKAIAEMERRMARFPERWAREGDVVLTDWHTSYARLVSQAGHPLQPLPWGWSKSLLRRLLRLGVPASLMPTAQEIDTWRTLSSRRFAARYIRLLLPLLPSLPLGGADMRFHEQTPGTPLPTPLICKPEFSSSGRGIRIGSPPTQGPFLADVFLEKILDCALLFHVSTAHQVRFLGASVFHTNARGAYLRQERLPQPQLRRLIEEASHFAPAQLDSLINAHLSLLTQTLAPHYRGFVGIDMLVAKDKYGHTLLHPCLEINLRMTMGIAWLLEEQAIALPLE